MHFKCPDPWTGLVPQYSFTLDLKCKRLCVVIVVVVLFSRIFWISKPEQWREIIYTVCRSELTVLRFKKKKCVCVFELLTYPSLSQACPEKLCNVLNLLLWSGAKGPSSSAKEAGEGPRAADPGALAGELAAPGGPQAPDGCQARRVGPPELGHRERGEHRDLHPRGADPALSAAEDRPAALPSAASPSPSVSELSDRHRPGVVVHLAGAAPEPPRSLDRLAHLLHRASLPCPEASCRHPNPFFSGTSKPTCVEKTPRRSLTFLSSFKLVCP